MVSAALDGIVVVNKPTGITSHDVVDIVRRKLKMRRVGHAGTLDPLATGVLVILLGKSTSLFNKFAVYDKAYRATLVLGMKTKTADIQGQVIQQLPYEEVTQARFAETLRNFYGDIEQIPPMVSAVKFQGRRLYQLARQGIEVQREPRKIRIDRLELLSFAPPRVSFYLECSKGTYVRKLAEDVGDQLGCGACIAQIERTKVGPFTIEQSVTLEDLTEKSVRPWQQT